MSTTALDRLLKADEAQDLLGVSKPRLYQLVREGLVPAVKLGRQIRFSPKVLGEFIERGGRAFGRPESQG